MGKKDWKEMDNCPRCWETRDGLLRRFSLNWIFTYKGREKVLWNAGTLKCDRCKEKIIDKENAVLESKELLDAFVQIVDITEQLEKCKEEAMEIEQAKQLIEAIWGEEINWQAYVKKDKPEEECYITRIYQADEMLFIALETLNGKVREVKYCQEFSVFMHELSFFAE